ncbi:MAG: hypothetical protein IJG45_08775, partial [Oscillospiraceae bacterium]|nr:hypothetical protein [Oscillospiraceae bacterium]
MVIPPLFLSGGAIPPILQNNYITGAFKKKVPISGRKRGRDIAISAAFSLSKNYTDAPVSGIMKETGVFFMEQWKKDGRKEVVMVDLEDLVPKD